MYSNAFESDFVVIPTRDNETDKFGHTGYKILVSDGVDGALDHMNERDILINSVGSHISATLTFSNDTLIECSACEHIAEEILDALYAHNTGKSRLIKEYISYIAYIAFKSCREDAKGQRMVPYDVIEHLETKLRENSELTDLQSRSREPGLKYLRKQKDESPSFSADSVYALHERLKKQFLPGVLQEELIQFVEYFKEEFSGYKFTPSELVFE